MWNLGLMNLKLCALNLFYEGNESEGKQRKLKNIRVLETILGEKRSKRKENKGKSPSKTFLPNVGVKRGKRKKRKLKGIKRITEIIKITKLPTIFL